MTPFLYWAAKHFPESFQDITVGGNTHEKDPTSSCQHGYMAAKGSGAPSHGNQVLR